MSGRGAWLPLLLAAGIGAGACATGAQRTGALPTGCWYFEQDTVARHLNLPWGVRLSEQALEGWPNLRGLHARQAATLTPEGDADVPFGYWRTLGADSLEIGFPGGGGLVLELEAAPTALHGRAVAVGDVLMPDDRPRIARPVRLTAALCPERA